MLNFSELYPVSNEIRQAQLLDGLWRFQFDPQEAGDKERWAERGLPAPISMPVPASFADVFTEAWQRDYCGDFWYETDVYAQEIRPGQRYFVRFGSVTHRCKVYMNGVLAVEHEGGFLPVIAEVTALLRPGRNLLTVKANNELNETSIPCGTVLRRADGSRQAAGYFDFFNYSGIHRSVWFLRVPEESIQDYSLTYRLEEGRAFIDYAVDAEGEYTVCVELRDHTGALVAAGEGRKGELTVEKPHLWQVRNAYLYSLTILLKKGNQTVDRYDAKIGIRTIAIEKEWI